MNITEIKQRLIKGNEKFVADKLERKLQNSNRRKELVDGQEPHTIVLSCADSRVVPELVFDAGLGELFVVRVAGNVANTSSLASIEYAVAHCKSKVIVVLGHQSCGAIKAAVEGGDNGPNLNHLLKHITPVLEASGENATVEEVVKKNVLLTIENLTKQSDIIKNSVDSCKVEIIPAYYNLDSGKVDFL